MHGGGHRHCLLPPPGPGRPRGRPALETLAAAGCDHIVLLEDDALPAAITPGELLARLRGALGDLDARDPDWLWLKLSIHNTWTLYGSFQWPVTLLRTSGLDLVCAAGGLIVALALSASHLRSCRSGASKHAYVLRQSRKLSGPRPPSSFGSDSRSIRERDSLCDPDPELLEQGIGRGLCPQHCLRLMQLPRSSSNVNPGPIVLLVFFVMCFAVGYWGVFAVLVSLPRTFFLTYPPGTHVFPHGCCVVAQAYNSQTLPQLLERVRADAGSAPQAHSHIFDRLLMRLVRDPALEPHAYMHIPHLFQHAGTISLSNPTQGLRVSESLAGPVADPVATLPEANLPQNVRASASPRDRWRAPDPRAGYGTGEVHRRSRAASRSARAPSPQPWRLGRLLFGLPDPNPPWLATSNTPNTDDPAAPSPAPQFYMQRSAQVRIRTDSASYSASAEAPMNDIPDHDPRPRDRPGSRIRVLNVKNNMAAPSTPRTRARSGRWACAAYHFEGTPADAQYVAGFRVAFGSLRSVGADCDFVMLLDPSVSAASRARFEADGIRCLEVPRVANPFLGDLKTGRFERTLGKLNLWSLRDYDSVLTFDADTVFLKNPAHLFDRECGDFCVPYISVCNFHTGLMVLTPSEAVYRSMLESAGRLVVRTQDGGDMGFLNAYFGSLQNWPLHHAGKLYADRPALSSTSQTIIWRPQEQVGQSLYHASSASSEEESAGSSSRSVDQGELDDLDRKRDGDSQLVTGIRARRLAALEGLRLARLPLSDAIHFIHLLLHPVESCGVPPTSVTFPASFIEAPVMKPWSFVIYPAGPTVTRMFWAEYLKLPGVVMLPPSAVWRMLLALAALAGFWRLCRRSLRSRPLGGRIVAALWDRAFVLMALLEILRPLECVMLAWYLLPPFPLHPLTGWTLIALNYAVLQDVWETFLPRFLQPDDIDAQAVSMRGRMWRAVRRMLITGGAVTLPVIVATSLNDGRLSVVFSGCFLCLFMFSAVQHGVAQARKILLWRSGADDSARPAAWAMGSRGSAPNSPPRSPLK